MNLREWLLGKQQELREADWPFAARLNVTGSYWGMVRRGEQRMTLRLVRAAVRAFPDYRETIIRLALDTDDPQLDQGDAA